MTCAKPWSNTTRTLTVTLTINEAERVLELVGYARLYGKREEERVLLSVVEKLKMAISTTQTCSFVVKNPAYRRHFLDLA